MEEKPLTLFEESRNIFIIGLILHFGFAIQNVPFYMISQYGLGAFLGRTLGSFLGVTLPLLLISSILSLIPHFVFKKNYFYCLSIIFLIISLFALWVLQKYWHLF